ncbi:MAG: hypothetical protein HY650_00220 [Acidobacteria bacterium]|nr:hypothetical protein [Acidobacteriota bacterium]
MRNTSAFTSSVSVMLGLIALVAMMGISHPEAAPSVTAAPVQITPAPGGAVSSSALNSTVSNAFVDMPSMTLNTSAIFFGGLLITLSGQSVCSNALTSLRIRCLVDGGVLSPGETVFDSGTGTECHSMSFLAPNVGLGGHQIKIQWRAVGGGTVFIDQRTLSYTNVN